MMPSIFVSHGAPNLLLQDVPARRFLRELGTTLPRPRAIVAVTAHWETRRPAVGAAPAPATIHDFGKFDDRLFTMQYPAPGAPELADRVSDLLCDAGVPSTLDPARGLDHGIWVPLMLMYPLADVPVVPLSVQPSCGPGHHLQVGRALTALRADGVLVLASGSFTHDLGRFGSQMLDAQPPDDVDAFSTWFDDALTAGQTTELLGYRTRAPHAALNHPTEEHLLPLFVALGAGGPTATRLHQSSTYAVLRMDAYAFS